MSDKITNDRPMFIDKETLAANWERTFGKKKGLFDKEPVKDESIQCEESGSNGEGKSV